MGDVSWCIFGDDFCGFDAALIVDDTESSGGGSKIIFLKPTNIIV